MAHYAFIGHDNKVVKVIVGVDETVTQVDTDGTEVGGSTEAWEQFYQNQPQHQGLLCRRTSYNARGEASDYRGVYAGVGYTYDAELDVFVAPVDEPEELLES